MSTDIYLIRHGEAEGNLYRRALGITESRLTAQGVSQAGAAKERFGTVKIDRAYSSPLLRARRTGEIVCEGHGIPVILRDDFREINLGVWENMQWGEIFERYPREYSTFMTDTDNWRVEMCETSVDAGRRFYSGVMDVARENEGRTIAIFTHGAVIRAFLREVLCRMPGGSAVDVGHSDNTGVTLLRLTGDTPGIIYMNDNSHLGELSNYKRHFALKEKVGFETNLRTREARPGDAAFLSGLGITRRGNGEVIYTALSGPEPAGALGLADTGEDLRITEFALAERFQGWDLGVQLIGTAVYIGRLKGRKLLEVQPRTAEAKGYFEHYEFAESGKDGVLYLDLGL